MRQLADNNETLCRYCFQRVRVNCWFSLGVAPAMALITFLLFQWQWLIAGAVLFFPTVIVVAGRDIIAVRWFPLTIMDDPNFPPPEKDDDIRQQSRG